MLGENIVTYTTINDQYLQQFVTEKEIVELQQSISMAHKQLHEKTGLGNAYLGWVEYPNLIQDDKIAKIKETAEKIKQHSDILLVIGVGGSYLGSRAAIELLSHTFINELPTEKREVPRVIFVGHHLSGTYFKDLFDLLDEHDVSVNVISKSGSTMETAIAFRIIHQYMKKRYKEQDLRERIFVTTGDSDSSLKQIAINENYKTFTIPNDIGGRYSVLTAVGLLPIAVSGISIDEMLNGARSAYDETKIDKIPENNSYYYAALRNILYTKGKKIEILSTYEPRWKYFQEWWKQLFGESEGKDGKGIFPALATYTTDLHSVGQYIQEGERHLFQTVLFAEEINNDVTIPLENNDLDNLNFLANKTIQQINRSASEGALLAHTAGGVPNIVINVPKVDAFTFGYLVYFFQKACAISGYVLQVNPFNQPGVEQYKRNTLSIIHKSR